MNSDPLPDSPRFSHLFILVLSLILAGTVGPEAVLAQAAPATHLRSTPGEVSFRVEFDRPTDVWRDTGGQTYRYPAWTTLSSPANPGEPALPAMVVRVALPPAVGAPDQGIRVSTRSVDREQQTGIRFPPSASWEEPSGTGAPARLVEKEGPAYRAGVRPQAEVMSVGIERGLRIANIAVRPVLWDPQSGATTISEAVTVTLTLSGVLPTSADPRSDAVAASSWRHTLINPEAAATFYPAQPDSFPPPGGIPGNWFNDADGWLKIRIEGNGVYAITPGDLAAAGVPAADPRGFRIYAGSLVPETAWTDLPWLTGGWANVFDRPGFEGGFDDPGAMQQVAIRVDGESDGVFSGSDRILFYALGPDNFRDRFGLAFDTAESFIENPYTDHTVYWLAWGGSFSDQPRRMAPVDATPQGGTVVVDGPGLVHAEGNSIYSPSLYENGVRWEEWFWDTLDNFSSGKQFFVDLPHLAQGSDLSTQIRLWGANIPTENGTGDDRLHHVQVDINDQNVGLYQWGGEFPEDALTRQDVSATVPAANPSRFVFRVPTVPSSDPARFDQVYLAWIDVSYRRFLVIDGVAEDLALDAGAAGRTVRVTSQPSLDMGVLDISDPRNPRDLTGVTITDGGSFNSVEFAFGSADSGRVAVYSVSSPLRPAAFNLDDPPGVSATQWLRDTTEPLDFVIVAHDDFVNEAETLAEWRRQNLYPVTPGRSGRVRVVAVSDIYDEFTWGMRDPAAIRYFLEYAYRYYGVPSDDRLAYCLFLGDHHYDYRDRLDTGNPVLVPSWEDNRNDIFEIFRGNVQYTSDDPLARFDGPFDAVTDLYLGRIPVTSAGQARTIIESKIVRSEETPHRNPWRSRVLLVADDLCQGGIQDPFGQAFTAESEIVDSLLPAEFDRRKLHLVDYGESCSILTKPDAQADLIELWNDGNWLVNYTGHGNEAYLADERILELGDIPLLENDIRLPIFVATASRTGKFNHPTLSYLTESLVLSTTGGAVAASGSGSNQTGPSLSFNLGRNMAANLFPTDVAHRPAAAGAAFMEAKRLVGAGTDIYTFFGDPATMPPVPSLPALVSGADSLIRGSVSTLTVSLPENPGQGGGAELFSEGVRVFRPVGVTGFDKPGELLFQGPFAMLADTTTVGFVVPVSAIPGDDARVRAYLYGSDWDALGSLDPIGLGGTADPSYDTEGPVIAFDPHPAEVVIGQELVVSLEDMSGINLGGSGVEIVVIDGSQTEVGRLPATDLFSYAGGSYTQGSVVFEVPELEFGPYTFTVNALDNYDNAGSGSTTVTVSATAGELSLSNVYAYPNPFNPDQNPRTQIVFTIDQQVAVDLKIFSVSGRLVHQDSLDDVEVNAGSNRFDWDGRDQRGDEIANGVYIAQITARGSGEPIKHIERLVLVR